MLPYFEVSLNRFFVVWTCDLFSLFLFLLFHLLCLPTKHDVVLIFDFNEPPSFFLSLTSFHLIYLPTTMIPTGHPSPAIAFRRRVLTYTPQGIIYLLSSLSEFWIFCSYANIEPSEVPFHYKGVTSLVLKMPYKGIFSLVDNSFSKIESTFLNTILPLNMPIKSQAIFFP